MGVMSNACLEATLRKALAEACGLGPGEGVLVGVSGGADSVALLEILCALNGRYGWSLKLHAAHLNHTLRGEAAEADAAFVAEHCRRLGVPCTVASADVAGRAAAEGVSIEQAGRLCRFEYFEQLCTAHGLGWIALGHHADDQAETVLHRIARGTGLRGLGGMRIVRPLRAGSDIRLIRPLLALTRARLEAYLADKNLPFRRDSSNHSPTHTRNRIRHEVLPLLRERLNPRVDEALQRLAAQAREMDAYVAAQATERAAGIVTYAGADRVEVDRAALARQPRVIQAELVRQLLSDLGAPQRDLSALQVDRVLALAAEEHGTRTVPLPGGFLVRACYDRLVFERAASDDRKTAYAPFEIQVAPEGITRLEKVGLEIEVERLPAGGSQAETDTGRWDECIDADAVRWPLIARPPRPGERFDPLGMGGETKKISDFLIDAKIAADRRSGVVLLCDQAGPVWVVGMRIAHRVRLIEATRNILRVRVRPTTGEATRPHDKRGTYASR